MENKSEGLKWLWENFNFIDSVTVVDNTGKIIAKKRFNPRFTMEENLEHNQLAIDKNILEVYPSLNHEDSTLLQVLNSGRIIYEENQEVWSHLGRKTVCNNITFPMITKGKIVGAVEISRDITHMDKLSRMERESHEFHRSLRGERMVLPVEKKKRGAARYDLADLITEDPEMLKIKETIRKIANRSSSVLVYGETGTGKELVVSAIHNAGYRKERPFIPVNCAALPESILEGLLFGSRRGAFTGAEEKKGLFEEADGGTIYLDEINSMPVNLQAKLLRVLQEKTVMPLGESRTVEIDVRIIASTNKSPEELLHDGEIRLDLLYRLNTINISIPPLRERPGDIPLLIAYFLQKYNQDFEKNITSISEKAERFLTDYNWIGNVRELEHVVEAAMNVAEDNGELRVEDLPAYLTVKESRYIGRLGTNAAEEDDAQAGKKKDSAILPLDQALEVYEKEMILRALEECGWKVTAASGRLQIPRTTLQYKMEKYRIQKSECKY